MQATQLPEPAAVPVQRPASPALAPALRTISGETPHYRARFEVAAADGADAAEAVKEIVMGWLHAKGLDVPESAADIAVPAGWTAADEPDAAKAVRFLGLSGAQGAAWAVPPRLQVAEIPAIGNRWRGSFFAHMAKPTAQTPGAITSRQRRRAAYEPGRFWVASIGNAGNMTRGEGEYVRHR